MVASPFSKKISQYKKSEQFDLKTISPANENVKGWFVQSTAPHNVEEEPRQFGSHNIEDVDGQLREIALHLAEGANSEIVIAIHGYANQSYSKKDSAAEGRYRAMYQHAIKANSATDSSKSKNVVFLGYLWPSEKISLDICSALRALPILPVVFFLAGMVCFILASFFILVFIFGNHRSLIILDRYLFWIPFIVAPIFPFFLALIALRLSNYFRDNYRATNYGAPDLVELLRWIDHYVVLCDFIKNKSNDPNKAITLNDNDLEYWLEEYKESEDKISKEINSKIKLSFIGHSMGCFVATNTIRILSDVFDDRAIEGDPTAEIGRVFCLERLVLVAPDIPVEAIMPRRANFLRASLNRCKEAYVFCNEADLALRLASTTANYFSFPAKNRASGYRLGNVTANTCQCQYGIVNPPPYFNNEQFPYGNLEIRTLNKKITLSELRPKEACLKDNEGVMIADKFTYFDCTDYVDYKSPHGDLVALEFLGEPTGVVSFAKRSALGIGDYVKLVLSMSQKKPRYIDTHGGYIDDQGRYIGYANIAPIHRGYFGGSIDTHSDYFKGILIQRLIYDLAFVGFKGMLYSCSNSSQSFNKLSPEDKASRSSLYDFSECCRRHQIKVVLSPERYKKDIRDQNHEEHGPT